MRHFDAIRVSSSLIVLDKFYLFFRSLMRCTETLDLDSNFFVSAIPTTIGQVTSLRSIRLGTNVLDGPLPSEIGNLVNLTNLELQNNFLSGELPAEVIALNIENLNLTGNLIV